MSLGGKHTSRQRHVRVSATRPLGCSNSNLGRLGSNLGRLGYSLYGLKRTGADALMDGDFGACVSIKTISYLCSHSDISTTQIYVGANRRRAHEELEQLTGWTNAVASIEDETTTDGAGNEIRTHDFNLGKVALYH